MITCSISHNPETRLIAIIDDQWSEEMLKSKLLESTPAETMNNHKGIGGDRVAGQANWRLETGWGMEESQGLERIVGRRSAIDRPEEKSFVSNSNFSPRTPGTNPNHKIGHCPIPNCGLSKFGRGHFLDSTSQPATVPKTIFTHFSFSLLHLSFVCANHFPTGIQVLSSPIATPHCLASLFFVLARRFPQRHLHQCSRRC